MSNHHAGPAVLLALYKARKQRTMFDKPGDPEIDNWAEKNAELFRRYWKQLESEGQINSKRQVESFDTIDVRGLGDRDSEGHPDYLPAFELTDEELAFANSNFYGFVPPLKQGALRVNDGRFILFRTDEISIAEKAVAVTLQDYSFASTVWSVEGACVGLACIGDNGEILAGSYGDMQTAEIIEKNRDFDESIFSTNDRLFWNIVSKPLLADDNREHPDQMKNTAFRFFTAIVKTNYLLSQHKATAVRSKSTGSKAHRFEIDPESGKRQIFRKVGPVSIRSANIPRLMNDELVRTYHIGAWTRRGFIRTLKSGKEVYIRPTTCHRKGYEKAEPTQVIMKMEGKGA